MMLVIIMTDPLKGDHDFDDCGNYDQYGLPP